MNHIKDFNSYYLAENDNSMTAYMVKMRKMPEWNQIFLQYIVNYLCHDTKFLDSIGQDVKKNAFHILMNTMFEVYPMEQLISMLDFIKSKITVKGNVDLNHPSFGKYLGDIKKDIAKRGKLTEAANPKKSFAMTTQVQDSIKKLCESMLHKEAMKHDEDENESHTYESYMNQCADYVKECINECMESWKASKM